MERDFLWRKYYALVLEVLSSDFMAQIAEKRLLSNSVEASMGRLDAAALYALVRLYRPSTILETGTYRGISSTFILKAMYDAGIKDGKLYSIERNKECGIGTLIPEYLKEGFVSIVGDVKSIIKVENSLPNIIDLFLHDSSHNYSHQLWEFETFWPMLREGGFLVSHDVDLNSSFVDFISSTYRHDKNGRTDWEQTKHQVWARVGNLGFIQKA